MNLPPLRLFCAALLLSACTAQEQPAASRSAQFPDYPQNLFDTFKVSCDGPDENFTKLGQDEFECRELLPPKTTAFLILNYDGFPQNLPTSIRRLSSTRNSDGYRVDADMFFLIPQKNGTSVKVPVESDILDQQITRLYRYFGGTPISAGNPKN